MKKSGGRKKKSAPKSKTEELRFKNPANEVESVEKKFFEDVRSIVQKFHSDVEAKGKLYGLNMKTQVYFEIIK